MTPQMRVEEKRPEAPASTPLAEPKKASVTEPHELTFAERQGLAMGWLSVALGIFLLLGGLALWASVALSAGFTGWLISMAVMGVITVAAILAVAYFVIRPGR